MRITATALSILFASLSFAQTRPAVPKGEVAKYTFDQSSIFPGTTRDYSIYIPRQYDPAKPACLFVCQDGVAFNAPAVFDSLIAEGKMPITIGVFITPGIVKAPTTAALDRFNRSYEYDGLSDSYVRFLLQEILPSVEKQTAADGRPIRISDIPDDRAIAGASSGGICAFTAAWQRPDSFHRIFTAIGSFTDLRGGNIYPSLVRKFEPKPFRIFIEDGSNDNNHYGGDWWMANQELQRALTFSGYEVNHFWGVGSHSHAEANKIFADAITWLWHDWPTPIKTGLGSEQLQQILIPGEDWKADDDPHPQPRAGVADSANVWFTDKAGEKKTVDSAVASPGGVELSPDQSLLYVADLQSHWIYSYQIQPDSSLNFKQPYFDLYVPDSADNVAPVALRVDRDGRLYVATTCGIQVCDQAGRVVAIIPVPGGAVTNLCFSGTNFDTLYAACGERWFARKLKTRGLSPSEPPLKPKPPKL